MLGCGWHFGLAAAGWHSLQLTEAGWRWLELAGVGIRLGSAITRSSPFEALTFLYRRSPCTGLQVENLQFSTRIREIEAHSYFEN